MSLSLSGLGLAFIPSCVYRMPLMERLDVSRNLIRRLVLGFERPLVKLDASHNRIKEVVVRSKDRRCHIEELDLRHNLLEAIPWPALGKMSGVCVVRIRAGNRIENSEGLT